MDALSVFLGNVVKLIIQPLLGLLFALALFMFGGGIIFLSLGGSSDPKKRVQERKVLLWGVIGFFVMVSAVAILSVVTTTFCGTAFCK